MISRESKSPECQLWAFLDYKNIYIILYKVSDYEKKVVYIGERQ